MSDEARADLAALLGQDRELAREALRQLQVLEQQPYAGQKLREKSNRRPLAEADCRKLRFDGYRIVYRLEPHEGSPDRVYVIAVAPKREAYGTGTARAAKRLRELAGERAARRPDRL